MESEAVPSKSEGEENRMGEKRAMAAEEGEIGRASKRMKRVAEIVLVLSGMAVMRGGKSPTEAELKLMEEAREGVTEIVDTVSAKPKDLLGDTFAIKGLIDDLGLNNVKDRGAGGAPVAFRGSRFSIKDRFLLSRRKLQDASKFIAPSGAFTSQAFKSSPGVVAESGGMSQQTGISLRSGVRPASVSQSHVSAATPKHATHQLSTGEVRAAATLSGSGTRVGKMERGGNGIPNAPQLQAANHPLHAPTWSIQPHSTATTKSGPENKFAQHVPVKAEGTADLGMARATSQAPRDQSYKPVTTQSATANLPNTHLPIQGAKHVQAPASVSIHQEIGKIVQKLLYPKPPEHLKWTPPSREYMTKLVLCQICRVPVNDVDTIVLCDSCEKGFHLQCIDPNNRKAISTAEWHCAKCVALNSGKPFPPKYGRVMRSVTPPKAPPNQAGGPSSLQKIVGSMDSNVNLEKMMKGESLGVSNSNGKEIPGINVTKV